jgi:predicted TPR repeat methyltransferase
MAYAQISVGDLDGARVSLKRTLEIDPDVPAATHMLKALDEKQATSIDAADDRYIIELFNTYAPIYDQQQKKLLYATPRVMRQELAKIYKEKYGEQGPTQQSPIDSIMDQISAQEAPATRTVWKNGIMKTEIVSDFKAAEKPVENSCSTYTSFMNGTLDILDLGCGTGLTGSWLKDYAKSLVGVDLAPEMVNAAQKKMMYQELYVMPLNEYLKDCKKDFDLVAAADVLSYVGDLALTFKQVRMLFICCVSWLPCIRLHKFHSFRM